MKTADMVLIGGGLIAAFIVYRAVRKPATSSSADPAAPVDYATRTNSWQGWDYYSNGTVIAPNGDYYSMGQLVWKAAQ